MAVNFATNHMPLAKRRPFVSCWCSLLVAAHVLLVMGGCGATVPQPSEKIGASAEPVEPMPKPAPTPPPVAAAPSAPSENAPPPFPAPVEATQRSLAGLAQHAEAAQFEIPSIEPGKLAAAGIRILAGKHITLYTDLPAATDVDELPQVFDIAVPLLGEYFNIEPARWADFKIAGYVMRDKERFQGAGLYPDNLPPFPHGYSRGSEIWLFDQPSAYYRRHLMLHEGTHAITSRLLGGSGPPWYMEGIAEFLATHRWENGELKLAYMPKTNEEVPCWGRVKIIRDESAAGRGMSLLQIMKYDARAHLKNEPYGWCWGAAAFLDQHPLTQEKFRALQSDTRDRSIDFSKRFYFALQPHWPAIHQDWELFTGEIDYGYDVARSAVVHRPSAPLPPAGEIVQVAANRGWQSTGVRLEAGRDYSLSAAGQVEIVGGQPPWVAEAGGVTIRYYRGRPLGMLLAAVGDDPPPIPSPLLNGMEVGLRTTFTSKQDGILFLRVNDSPAELADNSGEFSVTIQQQ